MSAIHTASKRFLQELGFLPYKKWPQLRLEHANARETKSERGKINRFVPQAHGIYIYTQNNEVLYVGKAVNLRARIHQHFKSSVFVERDGRKGSAGDQENGDWPAFFRDQCAGPVTVHWTEISEHENARRILELMLEWVINPKFVHFREQRRKFRTSRKRQEKAQAKLSTRTAS
jgi:hypothetical protein